MLDAKTEVIQVPPKPSLFKMMQEEPGMLAKVVAEWVFIALLVAGGLAIIFLCVVGGYSLVKIAP